MQSMKFVILMFLSIVLVSCSGLKSDPNIGLSPDTHQYGGVNVRDFTSAPLGAEVKVYLPISQEQAMQIVADFNSYPKWVSPAPKKVLVDNSETGNGQFGVGSKISYKKGETDVIQYYNENLAMIAKPLWGQNDFKDHRGVVLVSKYQNGTIMHMRRYFETKSFTGWFMSMMMPMFMKSSAENLAEQYNGKVL
ncbi:MAG: hypothetical protein AAF228_10010 [Pseudomonadota bacterium]